MSDRQHTPGPWRVGRTLPTAQTRKWSNAEWLANDLREGKMVFASLTHRDEGRSRERVAECHTLEDAAFIVETVNTHDDLVGALRDIARRAEDETLGIQAARLTAIANQAHAAIKDSEATA